MDEGGGKGKVEHEGGEGRMGAELNELDEGLEEEEEG